MSSKRPKKRKHIPQRTCVGCRQVQAKQTLIRIVRSNDGVQVDPTGKLAGRGAYLHNQISCWQKGLKGTLEHALLVKLTSIDREKLKSYVALLSDEISL